MTWRESARIGANVTGLVTFWFVLLASIGAGIVALHGAVGTLTTCLLVPVLFFAGCTVLLRYWSAITRWAAL